MKKIHKLGIVGAVLSLGGGLIFWFTFEAAPPAPAPAPSSLSSLSDAGDIRIVAFGDSLTAGYGLPLDEAYPALLERWLEERGWSVTMVNSGVSGETSAGGVRRAAFIRDLDPDIVLFGLGGNDALRLLSPDELEQNLRTAITTLRSGERMPIILLLGMRAPGNADPAYRQAFDAVYPRLAQEFGFALVPFFLEGVALDPRFNQADGIHPTAAGYEQIIETTVGPAVLPLLEEHSQR
jgi:acyl-CoA thioesterase I